MAPLLGVFLERYGDRVSPEHQDVCRRFVASLDDWIGRPPAAARPGPRRLPPRQHAVRRRRRAAPLRRGRLADRRLGVGDDRRLLLPGGLVDPRGPPGVRSRRSSREYFEQLGAHGVRGLSWEECWLGYRRQSFLGLLMTVGPAVIVERTPRGDDMFMTSVARYAQQVLDLDAFELLPQPGSRAAPPRPAPVDEHRHSAGRRAAVERELVLRRGRRRRRRSGRTCGLACTRTWASPGSPRSCAARDARRLPSSTSRRLSRPTSS